MKEFIHPLFGNEGIAATISFILFAIFGMSFIKIALYTIKKKAFNKANYPDRMKFNKRIWIDDNILDFVLAFMAAFGVFRFFPDAFSFLQSKFNIPEMSDKMAYGLLLGVFFQWIFHKLMENVTLENIKK